MTHLTLLDYLGPYQADLSITPEVRQNAERLIAIVNVVLAAAEADGVKLHIDPDTQTHIGGNGNGGVRPPDSPVGASKSAHKRGHAVDIYDPKRELAGWVWVNKNRVELLGIKSIERPEWTPTWLHVQDEPVASQVFAFIPNNSPAIADPLPEQLA